MEEIRKETILTKSGGKCPHVGHVIGNPPPSEGVAVSHGGAGEGPGGGGGAFLRGVRVQRQGHLVLL